MNFGREVARQTSCYTYVIEDEEPALACKNVFEVRLMAEDKGDLGDFFLFKDASLISKICNFREGCAEFGHFFFCLTPRLESNKYQRIKHLTVPAL